LNRVEIKDDNKKSEKDTLVSSCIARIQILRNGVALTIYILLEREACQTIDKRINRFSVQDRKGKILPNTNKTLCTLLRIHVSITHNPKIFQDSNGKLEKRQYL